MATDRGKNNGRKKNIWLLSPIILAFFIILLAFLTYLRVLGPQLEKVTLPARVGPATPPTVAAAKPTPQATPAPTRVGLDTARHPPEARPLPTQAAAPPDTLPAFFPPKATSTADLQNILNVIYHGYYARQGKGPTMRQLDRFLKVVLEFAGYNNLSHYWLEGESNPGFALVTRIEFINDVGMPVSDHRFDTELPPVYWFRGWEFLKALVFPDNGRYRLIALVVSQKPLVEKKAAMTTAEMEEINHGPSGLSERDWADKEITPDYFFVAYVYEFYRKTRSEPITFQESSDIQAQRHLASIDFDPGVQHLLDNNDF